MKDLNFGKAWLVFQKDWLEIRQSKQILAPIVILPLVIVVVLPLLAVQLPVSSSSTLLGGSANFATGGLGLPNALSSALNGMNSEQSYVYVMSTLVFAPFTLLVPLLVSSIISSDSFAGEKERKTIEGLLATPFSDAELLLGKTLAAFVPAIVATWGSAALYAAITDVLNYGLFGHAILPNPFWILILFGLAPEFAIASTGLSVVISSRVSGSREAQQLSGLLVIPIVVLMLGQISGVILLGMPALLALIGGVGLLDYFVMRLGLKLFNRERIISKL